MPEICSGLLFLLDDADVRTENIDGIPSAVISSGSIVDVSHVCSGPVLEESCVELVVDD